ncbi:TonB-dependent receptor [Flavobacterium gyeonganense]|uniref:TonB-dependent siderophore receptor n=1 Tax=Flavobacterium gyeonganense TaxID=1310418 RepID=A0ABV5HC71_9FLAO|nr:TonB-dependent receptor [Flavobacterium gyeonganense]
MKNSNKRILCFLLTIYSFLLFSFSAFAQQNHGKIKGTIATSDGDAAPGVNIILKNSKYTTVTNENGEFEFNRVRPNDYTLQVSLTGYETLEQEVTVSQNETASLSLQLKVSNKELKEVVINNNNKWTSKKTESVARMPIKNLENPQVYSLVTKELMAEQIITDYKQSLRNIPGAAVGHGNYSNGFTYTIMRGFWTGVRLRNGVASQGWNGIDPVVVERSEAIKGPSSTLFGSSLISFGGLINLVAKQPTENKMAQIDYTLGSYGLNRISADINMPLNKEKTILFRVNTAYHDEKTFMDWGFLKRFVIAPSLTYKVDERLTLSLQTEYLQAKSTLLPISDFSGTTFTNINQIPLRYDQSINSNDPVNAGGGTNVLVKAEYKISDKWKSTTISSLSHGFEDEFMAMIASWTDNSTITRTASSSLTDSRDFQFQQNFNGEFNIGSIKNRILFGLDLYSTNSEATGYVGGSEYSDVIDINQPYSPFSLEKAKAVREGLFRGTQITKGNTYGAYVSNVSNLTDKLLVMLSLRVDRFDNKGTSTLGGDYIGGYNQTALSPKLGIVYQPLKDQLSLFANYMNGFQNNSPFKQPDGNTENFKPSNGNQWEVGLKSELLQNRLSATISYYNIDLSNATRTDAQGFTRQDGKQRSKGVEVDITATPVRGLNIVAGCGFNDYQYILSDATSTVTESPLPANFVNFWISYKASNGFLKNFGLGGGFNYVGEAYSDNQYGQLTIPSYTLVDGTVFYDQPKWRLGLKVNNLLNDEMWGINNNPLNPRNVAANITLKL